jgi:hypothetical protein
MSNAMELTERNLEQVGSYVREHLGTWIRDVSPPVTTVQLDPAYLERIVRVEEELKSQRELMKQGFEQMGRRFEQADRRFEDMRADTNARFEQVDRRFEDINARFEESRADTNARFAEMRADTKAGFDASRSHLNHWMVGMTVAIGVIGAALALATVLVG